ncbi:MAG: hypothetical protein NTX83_05045 [Burkholderiales bacterium]|nr:hypothetical protein [Burkholderiales bacterium]
MKKAFPQILALIACALLTACGAGTNCVGYNGCSDTTASTTTTTTTTTTTPTTTSTPTSTTTYTIGGTISGLTSSTVVLQNNSGDALTISANSSTFTFSTAVASGATYAVTVGTQPTGLTCFITNGSGTASATVANVAVACRAPTTTTTTVISGVVSTFAGSGATGFVNGTGTAATFSDPRGMAINPSGNINGSGNIFVVDAGNHAIRQITPAGVVTTFAGTGTAGNVDGTGTAASFNNPVDVTVDSSGNLFVTSANSRHVRKITPAGVVTTFVGDVNNFISFANGTGTNALFESPQGITIDASNNLFVADGANRIIRKITPAAVVTTFAGLQGVGSTINGTVTVATFVFPVSLAIDSSSSLYVTDNFGNRIRKTTSAGVTTTFAGSGSSAYTNGTGTAASFRSLSGLAVNSSGNVYAVDTNAIRQITPAGVVTTFVGSTSTTSASVNGDLTVARFNLPNYLVFDSSDNLYVSEAGTGSFRIRKITITTTTTTTTTP